MRTRVIMAAFGVFCLIHLGDEGWAQNSTVSSSPTWTSDASLSLYVPSNDSSFLLPILSVERSLWHLEARYNYEDRNTASMFAGVTGRTGENVALEFTPMLGVVFGQTAGVAAGLELAFNWRQWELTSESEYFFDADDKNSNFFYSWSELSFYPMESWRVGLVGQRTQTYETEKDIERGPLVGFEQGTLSFTAYIFNVGYGSVYPVFTLGVSF